MDKRYYAIKEGKPLPFLDINAVFSAMYTPHTPTSSRMNDPIIHYKRGEDDFCVFNETDGALLGGKISSVLISKLKGYGIELNLAKE